MTTKKIHEAEAKFSAAKARLQEATERHKEITIFFLQLRKNGQRARHIRAAYPATWANSALRSETRRMLRQECAYRQRSLDALRLMALAVDESEAEGGAR